MSVTDIIKLNPSRIIFAIIITSVGLSILQEPIVDSRADGSESYQANFTATAATSGVVFFIGKLQGFEIAHKDSNRYTEETGGWAYYSFGHHDEPYADTIAAIPTAACAACYTASAAENMVFTHYYPILQTAKGAGDAGAGVDKSEAVKNIVGQSSDPKVAEIFNFSRTVVRSRSLVDSETIDKLRQVQVSEQEIVEIIAHIGLNLFAKYFNHVANTEFDFPYVTVVANQNAA